MTEDEKDAVIEVTKAVDNLNKVTSAARGLGLEVEFNMEEMFNIGMPYPETHISESIKKPILPRQIMKERRDNAD